MKYFIYWMKPEIWHHHKGYSDGEECVFSMVPVFQAFEESVPFNILDDVPVYTTSN